MNKILFLAILFCISIGIYFKKTSNQNVKEPEKPFIKEPKIEIQPDTGPEIPLKFEPKVIPITPKEIKTYADALAMAKISNKPIFLYFGGENCHWCTKMKTTFNDTQVKEQLNNYIVLMIDKSKNNDLAKKFNVSGIPCYLIIQSDETISAKDSGYKTPSDFSNWLAPRTMVDN